MSAFVNGLASGLGSSGGIEAGMNSLAGGIKGNPDTKLIMPTKNQMLVDPGKPDLSAAQNMPALPDSTFHPMSAHDHPFWNVMQAAAGAPGGVPGGGGAIPVVPQNGGAAPGLQNGGAAPEFTTPLPQAGIQPASTQGQLLTMDAGGVVPEGFISPSSASPPMTGRNAGLASGLASGITIGHDLRNAYLQRQAHKAAAAYSDSTLGIDAQNQVQPDSKESIVGRAKDAVEGFFHHLHLGTLNDNHAPNSEQGVPGAPPSDGTQPSPAPGASPIPSAAPLPAAAPAPGGPPSGAPSPAAAPAPGGPPAGAPPPGAAAPASGGPPAGAPPPTTQQVATATAVKNAATNPGTQQGIPQASPKDSGKPHSLSTDYWQDSQKKLLAAVHAAAAAGEDPSKVYESLTAMRTAHFQGQIVRNLGAAHVALMNGDQDAVKQALSNVNYYLPNGKGIKFKTATQADVDSKAAESVGQLMYRNPFHGLYGHENDPEYTSVNAQHIEALGTAALDPANVQSTILKSYTAQAQARKEDLTARGAFMTGKGREAWGQAQLNKSNIDARNESFNHYVEFSKGEANEAYARAQNAKANSTARTSGLPKIPMSTYRQAASSAATAVDNLTQGYATTAPAMVPRIGEDGQPVMGPDGKPVMEPNLSPGAGKSIRDPSKVPADFQGYTPDDKIQVQNLASHIAGSNVDMAPNDAALVAAKIYSYKTGRRFDAQAGKVMNDGAETGRHMDPVHHKVVRNVVPEPAPSDVLNVWMGNGWRQIHMNANIADDSTQGIPTEEPPAGGNPADNEPAVDSGPMNDDNQ